MENSKIDIPEEKSLLYGVLYYISILMKYKLLIVIGTTAAAVLVVAFSILSLRLPPEDSPLPNIYRAYAIVLFQEGTGNSGVSTMLSAFGIESASSTHSPSQVAMEILRSRLFLDRLIEEFDIISRFGISKNPKSSARRVLLDNSGFNFNRESGALTIYYNDIDPVFAADLVNYEVRLLDEWFSSNRGIHRSNELSLMEEKLNELSEEISEIENSIETLQKDLGVLDISEIVSAQSLMLIDLRTNLNEVELEISGYSDFSTIEDQALIILKSRRNNILNQIKRIEEGYVGSDGRRIPSIEELPKLSLDFAHLQADLALKNQLYRTLSERFEVTKLSISEEGFFSIMEYAEIPELKTGPSRGRLCIGVTFAAFVFFIFIAFMHNMVKTIADDPEKRDILRLKN